MPNRVARISTHGDSGRNRKVEQADHEDEEDAPHLVVHVDPADVDVLDRPVPSPVPDALRFLIRTVTKRVTPYVTTKPTSIHSAGERPVLTTWSTYQFHMVMSLR